MPGILALASLSGGCGVRDHGHYVQVDILDTYGYHHQGYYDEHHDCHGGYYDEHHQFHDDPHDWQRQGHRNRPGKGVGPGSIVVEIDLDLITAQLFAVLG